MITLAPFGAHGSLVCRDARGRFCSPPPGWREMWLEAGRRQKVAELRARRAAGAALHRELGDEHPRSERPLRLHTPTVAAHVRRGQIFTMPLRELARQHRERYLTGR